MNKNSCKNFDISRRTFLKTGIASYVGFELARCSNVKDGFINPFSSEEAYADESKVTTRIVVVSKTAIGIVVYDVGENPRVAISDANITITSLFNGKQVSGKSDAEGKIVLDVSELAEKDTKSSKDSENLQFNGSILITKQGYRDVYIPRTRIISHVGLALPTRKLQENEPYIKELSFDGWDIQYFKSTFMCCSANADQHEIVSNIYFPAKGNAKASIYATSNTGEAKLASKEINISNSGFHSVIFKEMFLHPRSDYCIKPKENLLFKLEYEGSTYTLVSAIEILEPPIEDVLSGNTNICPEANYYGDESITIATMPDSLPKPLAGSSFSLWRPSFPIAFDFSPFGYLMAGLNIGSLAVTNDSGFFDKEGWKRSPKQTAGKQYEEMSDFQNKQIEKYKESKTDPNDPDRTRGFNHELSKEFTLKGAFQIYANLQYDWDKSIWAGAINAVLGAYLDATWSLQMTIGPVPVFITFSMSGEAKGGLKFGTKSSGNSVAKLIDSAVYDTEGSGGSINICFGIALAAGVGISGVASVYVRGSGQLTLGCIFYDTSTIKNKPWPRLLIGAGVDVSLGVQLLLFKWSGSMWNKDFPRIYDTNNIKGNESTTFDIDETFKLQNTKSREFNPDDLPTIKEIADEAIIVTNQELLGCKELTSTTKNILNFSNSNLNADDFKVEDLGNDNYSIKMPEMSLYSNAKLQNYTYCGQNVVQTTNNSLSQVAGIAKGYYGGIKPSFDNLISKDVFSDARQKVVTFNNKTFLFRIASVDYAGNARSRLVYQQLKDDNTWGKPAVIDFETAGVDINRSELYDYDFDVIHVGEWNHYLYAFIISGKRDNGDSTTFASAASNHVASLIRIYDSNASSDSPLSVQTAVSWKALGETTSTKRVYSLMCPRIVSYTDTISTMQETNSCIMGTYLVHYADSANPEELLTDNARSGVVAFYCDHKRDTTPTIKLTKASLTRGASNMVPGKLVLDDNPEAYIKSTSKHMPFAYMNKYGSTIMTINVDTSGSEPVLNIPRAYAQDELISKIYHINSDDQFLCIRKKDESSQTVEGTLQIAKFDGKSPSSITFENAGTDECTPVDIVTSESGNWLFYAENTKGKTGQAFTDDGDNTIDIEDEIYRVVAIPKVNNKYIDRFTLCELDHPIDSIASITSTDKAATLIASQVIDLNSSKSNFYDIRIPFVACLTPLSVSTIDPFTYSGTKCDFNVCIRNDGNTIIDSAAFTLYLDDPQNGDKKIDTCYVNLSSEKTCTPGSKNTYKATFSIPQDWSGEKNVYVMLSDYTILNPSTRTLLKDSLTDISNNDRVVDYHIKADDCPLTSLTIDNVDECNDSNLNNGDFSKSNLGDDLANLVKTGDEVAKFGALGVLATALAGGMMAYSAKRMQCEDEGECDSSNLDTE